RRHVDAATGGAAPPPPPLGHGGAAVPRRGGLHPWQGAPRPSPHSRPGADGRGRAAGSARADPWRAGGPPPPGAGSVPPRRALPGGPSGPSKMEILDASGKGLRTEEVAAHQGVNGMNWDLRLDPPVLVALRTTPPENPHIWEEPRFQNTDVRRITHWGITPQTGIPMAAPGKYQVRFTVDGKEYTKPFDVIKDPAVETSDVDLQASTATQIQIRDAITQTSKMVNQMEIWRKQLEDQIKANQGKPDVVKPLEDMNKKILDVELQLVSRSEMLSDDKYFPEAYKAYMNLIWLSGGVGQGASDEAGSIDHRPTDTQLKVFTNLQGDVEKAQGGFLRLTRTDIPDFNKAMAGKVPPIADTVPGGK